MVTGAVNANHTDDGQDDVLAFNVFRQLAGKVNLDSLRNLEPGGAAGHSAADIGLAHAGAKSIECAVGTSVGIGTDDDFAGSNKAFIRQQCMLDTHLAYFKVVFDFVLAGEVTHTLAHGCGFDILAGGEMVRNQSNFVFIKYRFTDFFKFVDSRRTGDIIS